MRRHVFCDAAVVVLVARTHHRKHGPRVYEARVPAGLCSTHRVERAVAIHAPGLTRVIPAGGDARDTIAAVTQYKHDSSTFRQEKKTMSGEDELTHIIIWVLNQEAVPGDSTVDHHVYRSDGGSHSFSIGDVEGCDLARMMARITVIDQGEARVCVDGPPW